MTADVAEAAALRALAWLAGNDELMPVFLGSTGMGEGDLRARASEPEFLASVMDFILMDDRWVIACAEALDIAPEALAPIRAGLPGGDLPNWT